MTGSQKNIEANDHANGFSTPEDNRDAAAWNEAQLHSYLPEFCSLEIHAPKQELFASLDPDFFESAGEPMGGSDGSASASEWILNAANAENPDDRTTADSGEPAENKAASATWPNAAEDGNHWSEAVAAARGGDFDVQDLEDNEDEGVINPESAAITWNEVDNTLTVTAGTTQQFRCQDTETGPDGPSKEGIAPQPAREDEFDTDSGKPPSTSAGEKNATCFEPVFDTAESIAEAPERLESGPVEAGAEESAPPDPFEGADTIAEASEAETFDVAETAAGAPPPAAPAGAMVDAPRAPEEESFQTAEKAAGESVPLELTEAVAEADEMEAEGLLPPAEESIDASAPLELTEAVASSPAAPGQKSIASDPEADEESAPLELTDAVEASPPQPEPVAEHSLPEGDADFRAGMRALFAGAVRATKEKDYPTAIACLERFVSRSPNDPRGHYHLAMLRCRVGHFQAAGRAAEKAAALGAEGAGKLLKKIARKSAAQRPAPREALAGRAADAAVEPAPPAAAVQPEAVEPPTAAPQNAPEVNSAQAPVETVSSEEPSAKPETEDPVPAPESANTEGLPEFPTLFLDESGRKANEPEPLELPGADRGSAPSSTARRPQPQTDAAVSTPAAGGKAPPGEASADPRNALREHTANPDQSPKALYARGVEATNRKDYEVAVREFKKFISLSPDPARGYYNLAVLYYRLQDLTAAREYAELSVQRGVSAARKIIAKIEKHRRPSEKGAGNMNADTAAGPVDHASAADPPPSAAEAGKSGIPKNAAGEVPATEKPAPSTAGQTGDRTGAGTAPAREDQPPPDAAHTGRPPAAADDRTLSAEQINAWFSQGMQASQRKDYRTAVAHFDRFVAARPKEPKGYFNLAILHYRLQDYPLARSYAEKALGLGAEPAATILRKIERKTAANPGNVKKDSASNPATAALESAVEESTEDLAGRFLQEIQQTPAPPTLEDAPADTDASSPPEDAGPDRLASHIDTGESETKAGPDSGAASTDAAVETPSAGGAESAAQPTKTAKTANETEPKASEGLFARGMKASRSKDYATAIQCFERFVSQKPNEPRGHYNLAILHLRLHDYALARTYAEKTLALGLKSAAEILASIDAKEGKKSAASPPKPPGKPAIPSADETPNPEASGNPGATDSVQLFDVEELDTEDFDTSAFLKNESVVWDADDLEEAFDSAQPDGPVEENEYSFDDDIIVFDSPKEDAEATASEPAASRESDGQAAAPLPGDPHPGEASGNGAESPPESAPAPPGDGDEEETDRNFRLGKDAVVRKDYLQAVKHFTRVAELNPEDPRAFFQLAVISFRMKYFETSREHAERALGLGYQPARQLLETIQERAKAS